jgi:hypothetical protein
MRRFYGEAIIWPDDSTEESHEQREAALNILQKLKNFFGTDDLTEIDDMIDDERLTNEDGLTEDQAQEALAYLEDVQTQVERGQEVINRNLNSRSRW